MTRGSSATTVALARDEQRDTLRIVPAPTSCRLAIKVTPGAPRDAVVGEVGPAVRIKLRAPPVDGKANAALLAFLARRLGLHGSAVRLVAGAGSRQKFVEITGLAVDEARRRLLAET